MAVEDHVVELTAEIVAVLALQPGVLCDDAFVGTVRDLVEGIIRRRLHMLHRDSVMDGRRMPVRREYEPW